MNGLAGWQGGKVLFTMTRAYEHLEGSQAYLALCKVQGGRQTLGWLEPRGLGAQGSCRAVVPSSFQVLCTCTISQKLLHQVSVVQSMEDTKEAGTRKTSNSNCYVLEKLNLDLLRLVHSRLINTALHSLSLWVGSAVLTRLPDSQTT